ncbi:hypothetical protein GA0115259_101902, partial [Streptomyces sp. MnatMP-M17]
MNQPGTPRPERVRPTSLAELAARLGTEAPGPGEGAEPAAGPAGPAAGEGPGRPAARGE